MNRHAPLSRQAIFITLTPPTIDTLDCVVNSQTVGFLPLNPHNELIDLEIFTKFVARYHLGP